MGNELHPVARKRPPALPEPFNRKLYKTGQTRGASPAEIYQNRVIRPSTVLIPFSHWEACRTAEGVPYENGSIVLIGAADYFADPTALASAGLTLGVDALVFYTRRAEWATSPPHAMGWVPATRRIAPLGGSYVARVAATTSESGAPIQEGFTTRQSRGAGIRVYEYASGLTTELVRLQLEALLWRCTDARAVFEASGMTRAAIGERAASQREREQELGVDLLDLSRLRAARAIDAEGATICPLCLSRMSATAFSARVEQAAGRQRFDATITEASLFHIAELRVGRLGHKPYNVGWGHHHCNVVAKDAGVPATLDWMREVIRQNADWDG